MQLSLIQAKIYEIRGQKIIFDFDLAEMYGVSTKALKQAVKRNHGRFPPDFMFQLYMLEFESLRSQFVTSKRGGTRHMPFAFTEQGIARLSSILNSNKAIEVNIAIMRTFVSIRQYALNYKELQRKLQELEKEYNKNFKEIYEALHLLISNKLLQERTNKRERIGFKTKSST